MTNPCIWIILLASSNAIFALELSFRLQEEVPNGTVVASGTALGPLMANTASLPVIINRNSPGASSFGFVKRLHSGLELVVTGVVDRESICPAKEGASTEGLQAIGYSASRPFHIEDSGQMAMQSRFSPGYVSLAQQTMSDCIISLRVASSDKIFNVKIEILDINDNAPSWNTSVLHLSARDGDAVDTVLYLPLAEDLDAGLNGEITYSLQTGNAEYNAGHTYSDSHINWFELIKHSESPPGLQASGLLLPQQPATPKLALRSKTPIDREKSPEFIQLFLVARDAGSPTPQQGRLKIIINVTDVNDNSPTFERSLYKVNTLSENTPVGQTLLQLHAKDMDSGPNAELTYRFEDNGQAMLDTIRHFFEITPGGQLKVLRKLNVDKIVGEKNLPASAPITFQVIAVDGAAPAYALTGRTTVELHVTDTNDEAPKIQVYPVRPPVDRPGGTLNSVETTTQENGSTDQLLALVEVSDPDLDDSDTVECHLKGAVADQFQLEFTPSGSGKREYSLLTSARLDRETTPRLGVLIVCRDSADHVSQQEVGINLLDVNDNPPKFDKQSYEFFIQENDGEAEVPEASTSLLGDKRPVRSQSGESGVRAWDADAGDNAKLSFLLEPDPSDPASVSYFTIDPISGSIFSVASLDRETKSAHRFFVVATDHGDPAMSATAEVTIWVENLNDNVPHFVFQMSPDPGYTFAIDENEPPGRFVGQVTAVDADDGEIGDSTGWSIMERPLAKFGERASLSPKLIYSLGNEKDATAFRIDKYSGNITIRERLDRETQSSYTFRVYVSDGVLAEGSAEGPPTSPVGPQRLGPPKNRVHTMAALVTVSVRDQNDNRPKFIQPNAVDHLIHLDPATTPGRSLLQLNATDPDEGENGRVTYSIVDGNVGGIFYVAPVEGFLYLNGQIPRETIEKAAAASAAAASSSASQSPNGSGRPSKSEGIWRGALEGEVAKGAAEDEAPAHPTYVLKLEACDLGEQKLCTIFPNLQIQLRVHSDSNGDLSPGVYPEHLSGDRSGHFRNTLVEQVIIGLTVFFAVVVLIALLVFFLMRNGAAGICLCKSGSSRQGTATSKSKQAKTAVTTAMVGTGRSCEHEVIQIPNPYRGEEYVSSGATRLTIDGSLVDPRTGGHLVAGAQFPSAAQNLIDCPLYRNGYQMGNQAIGSQPCHPMGYGFLGPTSLITSRPPTNNLYHQSYRHDDYQCLDANATRPGNFGPAGEVYYQTSQAPHERYDSNSYPIITAATTVTTATRNNGTLLRRPVEFATSLSSNNDLEENDGSDSGSLELMKHPFSTETESYSPPVTSATLKSNSTALARSRTLNFPKATFV